MLRGGILTTLLFLTSVVACRAADGTEQAWAALRAGGHFAILRHATAPGIGDPPGFRLEDCRTQRLLSSRGRREARRIGEELREHGVQIDAIYSSQWCRCLQTAELLALGPVRPLPPLNSFFAQPEREDEQTAELREWIARQRPEGTIVLVTHQVNITALTALLPEPGDVIVIRPGTGGDMEVVGRIAASAPH